MIVKIKHEGDKYHKLKGEVVSIKSFDRIIVKMPDNKEIEFTEKYLSKVLPSENGHVWIISKK
jgi:exosome complex RNA-binding protein Rrp4